VGNYDAHSHEHGARFRPAHIATSEMNSQCDESASHAATPLV
jgi:hypothetical protein